MSASQFARQIASAFKFQGLQLTGDAMRAVTSVLGREEDPAAALSSVIIALKDRIEKHELRTSLIDEAAIAVVVTDLSNTADDLARDALTVFNAFAGPRIWYDPLRKTLQLEPEHERRSVLHAPPEAKAAMLKERLLLAQQRVARHELFRPPVISSSKRDYLKLTPLDSLLGSHGVKCLLGILTQPVEGQYHIEDLTCSVALDLSSAQCTAGLFTENCIIVVEGEMIDGAFRVNMMGFPPPETRAATIQAIGHADTFGTGMTPHQMSKLYALEQQSDDSMFVIISDLHLDKPTVLEKFRAVLEGFSVCDELPVFIMMGNFSSAPMNHTPESIAQTCANFDALGDLIAEFPDVAAEAKFVLVPGPHDTTLLNGNTLPQGALPRYFTKGLCDKVANIHLGTNPCRLRFYTQEIVLFRDDVLRKMQRHCVVPARNPPDKSDMEMSEHLVKTLLDQCHLCPLPIASKPIYCEFDSALSLYPLPHVVVLADHSDAYQWRYHDETWALNPGSFPVDNSFIVYRPSTYDPEASKC